MMPLAQRQSEALDLREWIALDAAAPLMGVSVRTLSWRASGDWSRHGLAVRRAMGRGRPRWFVKRVVDSRLAFSPDKLTRDERVRPALLENHPRDRVERAYRKAHWLREWRSRLAVRPAGLTDRMIAERVVIDAKAAEGDSFKISVRALQMWWSDYNAVGDDGQIRGVAALVDNYGGAPMLGDGDGSGDSRSPEAVAFFYACWHTENKLSVAQCHELTRRKAEAEGWSWPDGAASTARWLERYDDKARSCLMREGKARWASKYLPYDEQDWSLVEPGSFFVTDHKCCDFWVTDGKDQFRPWLTAVQDCRTRCIVGWHLGPSPHQDSILAAMRMAFAEWSVPNELRIDNGKDFTSKIITGLTKAEVRELRRQHGKKWKDVVRAERTKVQCDDPRWLGVAEELGIRLIYAIPYAPWSKGTLERWFRTFGDQCCKLFATWCGIDAKSKPECLADIREGRGRSCATAVSAVSPGLELIDSSDVPTLDEAREQIGAYIDRYHGARHRGLGLDGKSPLEVWNAATRLRRVDVDALGFLMSVRGLYKVHGNGVSITVGGGTIKYGGRHTRLQPFKGREVLIAMDATNQPQHCWAFDPATRRFIGRLDANERMDPDAKGDDIREANRATRRAQAVATKARNASAFRTRTLVQNVNALKRGPARVARATGTDDAAPRVAHTVDVVPVPTGFEGVSTAVRRHVEPPAPADEYAHVRMEDLRYDEPEAEPDDEYANIRIEDLRYTDDEP